MAHKHLSRQKIDPLLYMTEWFMCAFARTLPWSSVLRVWDMFFCEGTGLSLREHPCPQPSPAHGRGGFHFQGNSLKAPLHSPATLPLSRRSQDHLSGGVGAAEACARLPGEAQGLPGPV